MGATYLENVWAEAGGRGERREDVVSWRGQKKLKKKNCPAAIQLRQSALVWSTPVKWSTLVKYHGENTQSTFTFTRKSKLPLAADWLKRYQNKLLGLPFYWLKTNWLAYS